MFRSLSSNLSGFQGDTRGSIAILFALSALVIIGVVGLAIDVGRAIRAGTTIGAAVDAATIAGVKGLRLQNMSNQEVRDVVRTIFDTNIAGSGFTAPQINKFDVKIDRPKGKVELDVDAEIPTVLGQIAGINSMSLPRRSVALFEQKDVEVAVQLDVTGSMGGSKIADLKLATKDLVDILIPDDNSLTNGRKIRVGYAPYSAGVNAGSYAGSINGGVAAPDSCVYERANLGYQDTENFPTGASVLKTRLDLPTANSCSQAKVLPMTDDKVLLKQTVDGYTTGGSTAGHLGSAFAWYLLSPDWSTIWPAQSQPANYNAGDTIKVAILMTDGEYNTVGGRSSQTNASQSSQFAVDTCEAMKAKGITVYTVGFKLGVQSAINTLQSCASDAKKFYQANNGNALRSAFRAIAEDITVLRISE